MINRLNLSIPLIALLLVSCAGGISSQSSFESSSSNTFTVSFDSRGGSSVPNQIVEPNSFITPPNVTKEGHTLEGWYTSLNGGVTLENKWNFFIDRVNFNFTLIALWTVNQYTLTFESNGGSVIPSFTINYGDNLNILTTTKVGHSFVGWYTDVGLTQSFTLTTMPATNLTLYAKWTINQYTITFETNGGSSIASITGDYGDAVSVPSDPTREGYTFNGWYADVNLTEATTVPNAIPAQNLTLYAKWTINQYTITFLTNGGSSIQTQTNNYNAILSIPNATKVGHSFVGWYTDVGLTQSFTLTTMPATNLTLYAKWTINQYTITFETNGGSSIASITGDYGDAVSVPSDPTREGYTFNGWYADVNLTEATTVPNTIPSENQSFYSKWQAKTLSLSMGGFHSSLLTISSRVFMWGLNNSGQLGDGTTTNKSNPTEITSNFPLLIGEKFTELSMGRNHSSVLTSNGRVFTWGSNDLGQLGDGTRISRSNPTEITSNFSIGNNENIVNLIMGSYTSSALSSTGRVFVWGNNQNGQLGDGTTIRRTIPTEITSNFPLLIGEKITQLSMGGDHSSVLTSNGRVFTWGLNDSGQLGDGTTVSTSSPIEITSNFPIDNSEKISFLSLGVSHSSAFSSNGRIFVWGRNGSGQLGDGTSVSKSIPIDIRANFPLSIDEKIVSLSSGSDHSTALFESGRIFVWGMYITGVNVSNHNGNISTSFGHNWEPVESTSNFFLNGDEIILYSSIGDSHLSFLSSLGYVYIFGNNSYGQIGNFTNGNYSNTPFRLIV